ncbi:MAG: hypothetical protein AMXMBFR53_18880 [Gemmatimonadota bacterium]
MIHSLLADGTLALHVAFLLFVVFGGLAVLRWRRVAWLHVPCVLWGAWVELAGWVCPLTPLENRLRRLAGESGYAGGFLEHYVVPLLYPPGLTRGMQVALGVAALALNVGVYVVVWRRGRRARG